MGLPKDQPGPPQTEAPEAWLGPPQTEAPEDWLGPLRLRFGRTGRVFTSSWGLSNGNLFFLSDWKPEDKQES